ncbi:MAG: cellulase family glycosylhydrolase [Crocinitomicaceae bacterium]|nr:cellulase family glycosylhydrolase [Crocinitomicaceae bacterium]
MSRFIFNFFFLLFPICVNAQPNEFIHTSGQYILGPCNDTLKLKGVNYAPYNWGYTLADLKIDQIALTGSNVVRLVWYADGGGAPVYANYVALDSAISKCVQADMIVILELHDYTCDNDHPGLITNADWFISAPVLAVIEKYKHSLIVNIANESLFVNWTGNATVALANYKTTYETIITNLRAVSGFDFPLLIDAPDCGQNSDAFITSGTAADLITFDPAHNLIFSAHAYWYGYAANDSLQMANKLNAILAEEIPFVLGEIANQQDDITMCQYDLNYQPLLNYCEQQNIGWMAWVWDHDLCTDRQVSSTGDFVDLTTYGDDIVNNAVYGISTTTVRSEYLVNNGCLPVLSIATNFQSNSVSVFPNPGSGLFTIANLSDSKLLGATDLLGNMIPLTQIDNETLRLEQAQAGIYLLYFEDEHHNRSIVKLVVE